MNRSTLVSVIQSPPKLLLLALNIFVYQTVRPFQLNLRSIYHAFYENL